MPQVFCNNFRVNCNTINRATEKFKVVCDGGQLYRIQRTTHSYTASRGICTVLPSATQTSNYYRPLQRLWQSMNLIDYCGKNQGLLMALKAQLLESSGLYIEQEPYVPEPIEAYMGSHFKTVLELLSQYSEPFSQALQYAYS